MSLRTMFILKYYKVQITSAIAPRASNVSRGRPSPYHAISRSSLRFHHQLHGYPLASYVAFTARTVTSSIGFASRIVSMNFLNQLRSRRDTIAAQGRSCLRPWTRYSTLLGSDLSKIQTLRNISFLRYEQFFQTINFRVPRFFFFFW